MSISIGDIVYYYNCSICCGTTETFTKKSGVLGFENGSFVIWTENDTFKVNNEMKIYLENK